MAIFKKYDTVSSMRFIDTITLSWSKALDWSGQTYQNGRSWWMWASVKARILVILIAVASLAILLSLVTLKVMTPSEENRTPSPVSAPLNNTLPPNYALNPDLAAAQKECADNLKQLRSLALPYGQKNASFALRQQIDSLVLKIGVVCPNNEASASLPILDAYAAEK